jgi:hypothetical protein
LLPREPATIQSFDHTPVLYTRGDPYGFLAVAFADLNQRELERMKPWWFLKPLR